MHQSESFVSWAKLIMLRLKPVINDCNKKNLFSLRTRCKITLWLENIIFSQKHNSLSPVAK